MKYKVDGWNNFCRVFELPEEFSTDFCFGGGINTNFKMIDWFYPVPNVPQIAVSKEVWEKEVGPIESVEVDIEELEKSIIPFLKQKTYTKPNRQYLILYSFGGSTVFTKGLQDE